MVRVNDEAQGTFETKTLRVEDDVVEAIETAIENKEAASDYTKAKAKIKDAIPRVEEATQFLINEQWTVEATPYEAEGHEVSGGHRQRNRIGRVGDE